MRINGECESTTKNNDVTINNDIISSDLISDSEKYSNVCRPSARDKDKDPEVLVFKDLNTEAGEEE